MYNTIIRLLVAVALCVLLAGGCTTDIYETRVDGIEITVLMPNGETPVYDAKITVENEETREVFTGRTDTLGVYGRNVLSDATYKINVETENGLFIGLMRIEVDYGRSVRGLELDLETRAAGSRIALVDGPYDDIHAAFRELYVPHLTYDINHLGNSSNFAALDMLVIESGVDFEEDPMYSPKIYPNIEDFVSDGGTLILSDRAYFVIEELWPNRITFADPVLAGNGDQQINCSVTPQGYIGYLRADEYEIVYDLPNFAVVENVDGEVYLSGTYETSGGTVSDVPVLFSFDYGEGRVIYGNFNWREQLENEDYTRRAFTYIIANSND
ncbi:MAG: carboxypeptidase regulatory-like domain-containing protein [bacterium]|nr:carboxypeptidase regulatory-like domain-containing protein [bacterium]